MRAARWGHTEAAKALIEAGADLHTINRMRETALMVAEQRGHTETAKLLRKHGAKE